MGGFQRKYKRKNKLGSSQEGSMVHLKCLVFHSMTFGYTGCKVNKSGFRREMWVSLHRRTVGNKRKE